MKWGHLLVILLCAVAMGALVITGYNQFGPDSEELRQTNAWLLLGAVAGGLAAGAIIWWLPWPFVEMLWHRQPTDSAIYLMIILNTALLAVAYYNVTQLTAFVYPEAACIAAAGFIYYRNYTVQY